MSDSCGGKEKLKKYLVLRRLGFLAIQEAMNEFVELGYEVRSLYPNFDSSLPNKMSDFEQVWYAFIELKGGYENVTNLKDVPSEEVDNYIAKGWEIASTSISAKFIRMVKRRKE